MFVSALVGTTIILRAGRRSTVRSTKVGVVKPQNKTNHVIVMARGDNVGEVPLRVQSKKPEKFTVAISQSVDRKLHAAEQATRLSPWPALSNPIRRSLVLSSDGFCLVFRCGFHFLFRYVSCIVPQSCLADSSMSTTNRLPPSRACSAGRCTAYRQPQQAYQKCLKIAQGNLSINPRSDIFLQQ